MILSKFGLDYYLYRYIIIIFIISSDDLNCWFSCFLFWL